MLGAPFSLHVVESTTHPGHLSWVCWVQEDRQGNRCDRLFAGRVKLQEDPIATAVLVMDETVKQLQGVLHVGVDELPF